MSSMDTNSPVAAAVLIEAPALPEPREANVPALVAALYEEAPVGLRQRLLNHLLRPVGPLALVAVATGAFASLLPHERWSGAYAQLDDVLRIRPDQVLDLTRYVQQKSPEMLMRLPEIIASSPVALGTLSGVLLLTALRALQRERKPARG
ncbi:MAG TPA: hypothetical protein VF107_16230 [Burkholderiaceae bacterium]